MADIRIDISRKGTPLKKLHGVNNGPITFGSLLDVSHHYRNAGIPLVRLHDTNWPHPREVDIHTIFPDFSKDPEDPGSYDFARTDEYIASILATGAKIVYRLGESIEHTRNKYYVHPPADFAKWARICIGIIRHYNEGWANGFHYDIRYWEIWNEPDNPYGDLMWSGTDEQYFELYQVASTAIKRHDPSLKVGGQAATMVNLDFTRRFIEYCGQNRLPLDFFTWHAYTDDPHAVANNARMLKEWLAAAGYPDIENHLNEWSYIKFETEKDNSRLWEQGGEWQRRKMFDRQKNEEGASFTAALFALLQDSPVDEANYYDGQPVNLYCCLFDRYGVPEKLYDVFHKFNELCCYENRVEATVDEGVKGIYALGVSNENGESALWVANFTGESREYEAEWAGFSDPSQTLNVETLILDRDHRFDCPEYGKLPSNQFNWRMFLPRHSVFIAKLGPATTAPELSLSDECLERGQ